MRTLKLKLIQGTVNMEPIIRKNQNMEVVNSQNIISGKNICGYANQ